MSVTLWILPSKLQFSKCSDFSENPKIITIINGKNKPFKLFWMSVTAKKSLRFDLWSLYCKNFGSDFKVSYSYLQLNCNLWLIKWSLCFVPHQQSILCTKGYVDHVNKAIKSAIWLLDTENSSGIWLYVKNLRGSIFSYILKTLIRRKTIILCLSEICTDGV